jgi:hypothetical protein
VGRYLPFRQPLNHLGASGHPKQLIAKKSRYDEIGNDIHSTSC